MSELKTRPASRPFHSKSVNLLMNRGLKKLGLQLERRKAPVEMLIIDNVEKTPIEN